MENLRRAAQLAIVCALVLTTGCATRGKPRRADPANAAPAGDEATPDASAPLPEANDPTEGSEVTTVFRGARVMTAAGADYPKADVVVRGETIVEVGIAVSIPEGARIVDVRGKTITPGIIDTHSHIGVYASPGFEAHADGNEMVSPTTPAARAEDGYWPQDPQLERARAGGVTTMQILPGSANLIGGRSVVVKTYPHARRVDEARFAGAPFGLKLACGENPKRTYGAKGGPASRMGNMAGFRSQFQAAQEYRRSWQRYHASKTSSAGPHAPVHGAAGRKGGDRNPESSEPPKRDFGLDTLAGVLEGKILVHNHCYRADEMALMMQLAKDYGFSIRSFHHAVEAYKIADLLAEHGAAASMWADWWGFKAEAYDGIRENAAMVSAAGARAIIHSDSAQGIQRLNQEAAKAMWAGRRAGIAIPDDEALRWITANPAWALGVADDVGTIEAGKQADLVVWDSDPFSVYAHAERVLIEGETVFVRGIQTPHSDFETGWRRAEEHAAPDPAKTSSRAPKKPAAAPKPTRLAFEASAGTDALSLAGCTVHIGDGTVLEDASIVTRGARLVHVGPGTPTTPDPIRPPQPCVVTPGFIAAGSALGLVEIGAEASTRDNAREDEHPIRAGYDASTAINADSSLIAVSRIEGVTSAAVTPTGGLLSGQVAFIDLVGAGHRSIVAKRSVAVAGTLSSSVAMGSRAAALSLLQRAFADATFWRARLAAYDRRQSRDLVAHPTDLAGLLPVLDGTARLVVRADRASDILALVDLASATKIKLTIVGAAQGYQVADALAAAGVVVLVQPTQNLPYTLDALGARLDNAALLHAAGVTVGIGALDSAHNARNITQEAGIAIANGLPRDAAVAAVTLNVAKAYGMAGDYGSLTPGKVANFVVWRGDPFELSTMPEAVVIRGASVPLRSRQTELRERYRDLSKFPAAKR